jgi:hypothetical protein
LLRTHELGFVKIGARTLIAEREIARFITAHTRGTGSPPTP